MFRASHEFFQVSTPDSRSTRQRLDDESLCYKNVRSLKRFEFLFLMQLYVALESDFNQSWLFVDSIDRTRVIGLDTDRRKIDWEYVNWLFAIFGYAARYSKISDPKSDIVMGLIIMELLASNSLPTNWHNKVLFIGLSSPRAFRGIWRSNNTPYIT